MNAMTIEQQLDNLGLQAEYALYNVGAYNSFVTCMIARPAWIADAAQQVPPDWLHIKHYRVIYEMMLAMYFAGRAQGWTPQFTAESIYTYACSQGRSEELVDPKSKECEVLRSVCTTATSSNVNPEAVIQQVLYTLRETATRVAVYRQGRRMVHGVLSSTGGVGAVQVLAATQNELSSLATGIVNVQQAVQRVGDADLGTMQNNGIRASHLPKLADLTGGFQPSTLSIICARTNVGKSVFMGSIALDIAVNQRIPVLFLDTEMGAQQMLKRSIAWATGIDENLLFKRGGYANDPTLRQQADAAQAQIKASPFFHVDISAMEFDAAAGIIRQFRRCFVDATEARRGLIVFDYLKAPVSRVPEWQMLGDLALKLRNLAKETDLPIIAGMQASRAAMQFVQADYAENGVGIAAGSDRPAHHSDLFCVLRNLGSDEAGRVAQKFGTVEAEHVQNRIRFNQVLHVNKARGCPTLPKGIPLFYSHGTAQYRELAHQRGADGQFVADNQGRWLESAEISYLHSTEFQQKSARKSSLPPMKIKAA